MAEIITSMDLKRTRIGKLEEAMDIVGQCINAENAESKPNKAKIARWKKAQEAYKTTKEIADKVYDKIMAEPKLKGLLDGNRNMQSIITMQTKLQEKGLSFEQFLNGEVDLSKIQDVELGSTLFGDDGALTNYGKAAGKDIMEGKGKAIGIQKALSVVAVASFAASGVNAIFGAGTVGSILSTVIPNALTFAGNAISGLWAFNPLGTAALGAMLAIKLVPHIARFLNKAKAKYQSITRTSDLQSKLKGLAEDQEFAVDNSKYEKSEESEHSTGTGTKTTGTGTKTTGTTAKTTGTTTKTTGTTTKTTPDLPKPEEIKFADTGNPAENTELKGLAIQYTNTIEELLNVAREFEALIPEYNEATETFGFGVKTDKDGNQVNKESKEIEAEIAEKKQKYTELMARKKAATEKINALTAKMKAVAARYQNTELGNTLNLSIEGFINEQTKNFGEPLGKSFSALEGKYAKFMNEAENNLTAAKEDEKGDPARCLEVTQLTQHLRTSKDKLKELLSQGNEPAAKAQLAEMNSTFPKIEAAFNAIVTTEGKQSVQVYFNLSKNMMISAEKYIANPDHAKPKKAETSEKNETQESTSTEQNSKQNLQTAFENFKDMKATIAQYQRGGGGKNPGFGYVEADPKNPDSERRYKVVDELGLDKEDADLMYGLLDAVVAGRSGKEGGGKGQFGHAVIKNEQKIHPDSEIAKAAKAIEERIKQ